MFELLNYRTSKPYIKEERMKTVKTSLILSFALASVASTAMAESRGYIVKLKDGAALSNKSLGEVTPIKVSFGNFVKVEGVSDKAASDLALDPNVEYIEPNYVYGLPKIEYGEVLGGDKASVRDSYYDKQWGLKNTGRNSGGWFSSGKAGEDMNAENAWDITKGNQELIVAVIDTGVDYTHPDLKGNLWVNTAEQNGQAGVDDDGNGYVDDVYGYDFAGKDGDPMDGHGHGTHCAGNIGAAHNNEGIAGMMANVKIMSIKFLSDRGSGTTEDAILAVDYATRNGAKIMSNSWGGGERSEALKEAIERARDAGIVFVAAAGNESSNNDRRETFPANYDVENVITVGAMEGKGKRSSFSNYGATKVHVFAPGSNIYSTVRSGRYQSMSGTSMATPLVSGAVGLLLSHEPNLSVSEVRERVIATAVNNGELEDMSVSNGRMDTKRLLLDER